jgi:hypothetical protein
MGHSRYQPVAEKRFICILAALPQSSLRNEP